MNNLIQFIYDFVENNRKEDWLSFEDARKFNIVAHQLEILKAQRDEARREVCNNEAKHLPTMADPRREAERRGWDCFEEIA